MIGVGNQDTANFVMDCPDISSRVSRKCIVKQAHVNNIAQKVDSKLDSITVKYDKGIEDILRLLDEKYDPLNHE